MAEFALTVIDEFQGQGIGRALLTRLIQTARDNGLSTLRGHVLSGNRIMLSLCRSFDAELCVDPPFSITADIHL